MSWVFARMLILAFPVALYFIGLPATRFSKEWQLKRAGGDQALGGQNLQELVKDATVRWRRPRKSDSTIVTVFKTEHRAQSPQDGTQGRWRAAIRARSPTPEQPKKFSELNDAALDAGKRKYMEGETAILEGRFKRLADKEFSLFRMKMTCCASDTVPLKVRIIVPQAVGHFNDFDWVRVKGQIQFWQVPGQDRYIPVLMVADVKDITTPPTPERIRAVMRTAKVSESCPLL